MTAMQSKYLYMQAFEMACWLWLAITTLAHERGPT